jgi:hypothetical protein
VGIPNGWARTWGGAHDDEGLSVAIDGSGNVYVTGDFFGTVDFDPGVAVDNHTSNGWCDAFLSKFDPNGNFVWARTWGGFDFDRGLSVAIDGSGNPYVTGYFQYTVDFDPGAGVDNHTSNGAWAAFLSKFDPNGDFVRALTWSGEHHDAGLSIAIDGSGNAYVSGWFGDTVDFDPGAGVDDHSSNGWHDAFLSKFDPNGNFIWARTWGGSDDDDGLSVAIDGSGNAYIAGQFAGSVDFDPGAGVDNHTDYSHYYSDVFLSKFDPDGDFVWARTWGGEYWDQGSSVAIDGSGAVYVTGMFESTVDFDPGPGVDNHTSNEDAFVSKFDPDGNFVWARTWEGSGISRGLSIAIDGTANVYVTGIFNGTVDFDPGTGVDNHTLGGTFLSKVDPNGNLVWARTWGGPDFYPRGSSVAIDGSGNAFVTGYFRGTVDFDPGACADNHTSNGGGDVFLSKFPPDGNW